MPEPVTISPSPTSAARIQMSKAILQIAEGLAEFAASVEEISKQEPLSEDLLMLAHDIRKPVMRTLVIFQRISFPDDPIERLETWTKAFR